MRKIVLVALVCLLGQNAWAHKFYMSITEMNYNQEHGSLEIIIKLFTDDIEKALESEIDYALFLGTDKEATQTDSLLELYLKKQFSLKENGNSMSIDFLGKEAERDYTWLYIEVPNFNPKAGHSLKHAMLTEVFEDQKNQVNYYYQNEVTTLNLRKGQLWAKF
ncbi:MAG: hypothetical protein RIC95_13020 [Vicingaceae bacterium]